MEWDEPRVTQGIPKGGWGGVSVDTWRLSCLSAGVSERKEMGITGQAEWGVELVRSRTF